MCREEKWSRVYPSRTNAKSRAGRGRWLRPPAKHLWHSVRQFSIRAATLVRSSAGDNFRHRQISRLRMHHRCRNVLNRFVQHHRDGTRENRRRSGRFPVVQSGRFFRHEATRPAGRVRSPKRAPDDSCHAFEEIPIRLVERVEFRALHVNDAQHAVVLVVNDRHHDL